jgi:hypothetical protein
MGSHSVAGIALAKVIDWRAMPTRETRPTPASGRPRRVAERASSRGSSSSSRSSSSRKGLPAGIGLGSVRARFCSSSALLFVFAIAAGLATAVATAGP